MRRLALALVSLSLVACNYEQPQEPMRMLFAPASGTPGECFSKLNIQLFDSTGTKVFSKVKVQNAGDSGFGSLAVDLSGTYTVVAVGHSCATSATIKSPQLVQFTASNGEKNTDTFCFCGQVDMSADERSYEVTMDRATAMFRLSMESEQVPAGVTKLLFEYTGGSANFNPTTMQGCTKSNQSESRTFTGLGSYDVFTFPYMADSCRIKMTISAMDAAGQVVRKRVFNSVPMVMNQITEYRGRFFADDDDPWAVVSLHFTVNSGWADHTVVRF